MPPSAWLSRNPWLIAGPTAVGKSEVALQLAERVNGEIISVDSMQVYRGLDIGTAKPTRADRQRLPHHLIDVASLSESFDAARFLQLAAQAVSQIHSRRRVPVFCGGTGLYFKAWLEGLGTAPPPDPALRADLEKTPLPLLLEELARTDPDTYGSIDRQNPRRVIRALEVIRLTGRPFAQQRAAWRTASHETSPAQAPLPGFIGLRRATPDLHARIDQRVDQMFRQGLVEETQQLLRAGLERNPTALQSIGYRQVVEFLRGERDLPQTIALVKQRTRQLARRQMTWFRNQAPLQWLAISPNESPVTTVHRLLAEVTSGAPPNEDFSRE